MHSITRRVVTGFTAVALVAGGAIGALAAFSDSETVSESVTAGTLTLHGKGSRTLSTSPGDSPTGSSYDGDLVSNTWANYSGSPSQRNLPGDFNISIEVGEDTGELDDWGVYYLEVRPRHCGLSNTVLTEVYLVGPRVDLEQAGIPADAEVLPLADGFTFDVSSPENQKLCITTQLRVVDAGNEAQGDTFTVDQTVTLTETGISGG